MAFVPAFTGAGVHILVQRPDVKQSAGFRRDVPNNIPGKRYF